MEQHLPELIYDLAVILTAASIVTILFKRMRQPVVLGYIIAGFLVGPHVSFLPTITDLPTVKVWGEIGVIFLMFSLGLEFSFKKLARVGGAATMTAAVEISAMITIGYLTGRWLGWSQMDSAFLGGILAISSTTIILRAFDEVGVKGRRFVSLVLGVVIVEDLAAVVILVMLSTLAISRQFQGAEMAASVVQLVFFLVLWFLSGIFLIPTLLRKLRPLLSEETLLVVSVGMCFLMVILATTAGFSPALGAFIMGSIFAETNDAEKIEGVVRPVKNLFAAVFFVSVGTLIDPKILIEYAGPILLLTVVFVCGKTLSAAFGALLAGQPLRHAVQTGFSLAQIGEFSFIIAGLGVTLGVTSDFLYPVAVGVSVITTFTTPYMIKTSDRVYGLLDRHLPDRWKDALVSYVMSSQRLSMTSEWRNLTKSYISRIVVNAVIIAAIFTAVSRLVPAYIQTRVEDARLVTALGLAIALIASTPFWWAWLFRRPAYLGDQNLSEQNRLKGHIFVLEVARLASAVALFAFLTRQMVSTRIAVFVTALWAAIVFALFARHWKRVYIWLEQRFVSNLKEREQSHQIPQIAPWDAHIVRLEVSPESEAVGKTLVECKIRERFGVTIALIERGRRSISAPMRTERLYPHDRIAVIGTDEQLANFRPFIEFSVAHDAKQNGDAVLQDYSLHQIRIAESSPYRSRTIRDSGIRENTKGLVVGLERKGNRILNPDSLLEIETGDILWIVGDSQLIRRL